jgi:hypothetical protein
MTTLTPLLDVPLPRMPQVTAIVAPVIGDDAGIIDRVRNATQWDLMLCQRNIHHTPIDVSDEWLASRSAPLRLAILYRPVYNEIVTWGSRSGPTFSDSFFGTIDAALRIHARRGIETAPPPSRAYRAFQEIAATLGYSTSETAELLTLSRGTVYAWKAGREPQPRNARRLYQLHTLIRTLNRRLGLPATRTWLNSGKPAPLELLATGDFAAVDRQASEMIFHAPPPASERVAAHIDEPLTEGTWPADGEPATAPRRIRRHALRRRAQ